MPVNAHQPSIEKIIFLLGDITLSIHQQKATVVNSGGSLGWHSESNTSGRNDEMPPSSSIITTTVCYGHVGIVYIQLVIAKLPSKLTRKIGSQLASRPVVQ